MQLSQIHTTWTPTGSPAAEMRFSVSPKANLCGGLEISNYQPRFVGGSDRLEEKED